MSSIGGSSRKLFACESLDHVASLAYVTAETYPMFLMFYSEMWKVSFEKKPVLPIKKFPSLVLPRNVIMLQHLIQFPLYYLSSDLSQEVKNK